MQGATVIDVNAEGKVTSWRDYLDTNEPMQQIQAGIEAAGESEPSGNGNGNGNGPTNGTGDGKSTGAGTGTNA
jgi:hypothetical protein